MYAVGMRLPTQGEQLKGRYLIEEVLGEGGFAVVYRGLDVTLSRPVAIKVLKFEENGYDETREERFFRELRAIANLQNPHTVTLYDFGRSEHGALFMVCEFAEGEDLSEYLKRFGVMSEHQTVELVLQVLDSLDEAHGAGLIHRDIKPANVRVRVRRGRLEARVLDFGLAKSLVRVQSALTMTGKVVGTPRYMSPEQLRGEELTVASDIYSVGLLAYACLVGPHSVPMLSATKLMRLPEDAATPGLRSVINRMLARSVDARLGTAKEAITELEQLNLAEAGAPAEPRPLAPRTPAEPDDTIVEVPHDATTRDFPMDGIAADTIDDAEQAPRTPGYGKLPKELRRRRRRREKERARRRALLRKVAVGAVGFAVLAMLVFAIVRVLQAPEPASQLVVVPPSPAPLLPEDGCGSSFDEGVFRLASVTQNDREFTLISASTAPNERLPLVVFATSTSAPSTDGTSLRTLAFNREFLLLEVDAAAGRAGLVDAAQAARNARCVDDARIFFVGVGRGANLVSRSKLDFAAIATLSAEPVAPPGGVPHVHVVTRSRCFAVSNIGKFVTHWIARNQCVSHVRPMNTGECQKLACTTPFTLCNGGWGSRWEPTCDAPDSFDPGGEIWSFFQEVTSAPSPNE